MFPSISVQSLSAKGFHRRKTRCQHTSLFSVSVSLRLLTLWQRSRGTAVAINYSGSTQRIDLFIACGKSTEELEPRRCVEGQGRLSQSPHTETKWEWGETESRGKRMFWSWMSGSNWVKLISIQQDCCLARLIGAEQICNTRNILICDPYGAISRCAYKCACKTRNVLLWKLTFPPGKDQRMLYE